LGAELFKLARHERAWANERHARAELEETENIRACDATKQNVADDRDVQPGDSASALADRVEVEKRLRRVFVRPVASVDYARLQSVCQKLRRACGAVAQHDNIGMQRLEIARGVLERFAFSQTRRHCRDIDYVSAQAKCSQLERRACACARLNKKVDQRFAAQCRHFLDLACADLLKRVGCLENEIDFV